MNLKIIERNATTTLINIWKVIDLPKISSQDLLYQLSFKLLLFPPPKAKEFITLSLKNKLLLRTTDNELNLSKTLQDKLNAWQRTRKRLIMKKIDTTQKSEKVANMIERDVGSNFNILLKALTDRNTINRAISISTESLNIIKLDLNEGILQSEIKGTKDNSYKILIDINKKIITHDCHDFQARRAADKKFCKHLVKLFLTINKKDKNSANTFLINIAENLKDWEFTS